MEVARIECEAFKSFVEPTGLDVARLPHGLHRVRGSNDTNARMGSNGAGKTTFFSDAASWCLYGRTVSGLRTADVQSWLTKERPRAALTVAAGKGKRVIQRGPRASDLTIDGRAVGQSDVEALVGIDCAVWCQAVVLGQGAPLFFDLAPAAKMALLADTLQLERWEARARAAGERARRLEDRAGESRGNIRGLEAALAHAGQALETARDAVSEWGAGHAARMAETEAIARAARAAALKIEEKLGEGQMAAERAGLAARDQRAAVAERRKRAADARRLADRAGAELAQAERMATAAREGAGALEAEGRCPTCGQPVGKRGAAAHAREAQGKIRELEAALARARKAADKLDAGARSAERALATHEDKLEELEEAERRADGHVRLLDHELGAARAKAAAADADRRRVESEENPHRQAAQEARARLRELKQSKREEEARLARLEASAERAQFWARGFRDIRLEIIDDVLGELRDTTAEVLDALGLGTWSVDYVTERETKSGTLQRALSVVIRSPSAPEGVRWESYSGGERQRLLLAGALALSEVLLARAGASIDIRVLDEPTRGLSPEGVRDLIEELGHYAESARLKIFLIDHMSHSSRTFASTVMVRGTEAGAALEA